MQASSAAFLVFLCHINTFGYNPLKLKFKKNIHFSSLQDAEIIQTLEELEWNLNSGSEVPTFVKSELLKQLKKAVLIHGLCPFMTSFVKANIQPFSPTACHQLAQDISYLVKQSASESHSSLLAVKKVIDSLSAQFESYREVAAKHISKASLFLASLQVVEKVWPPAKLSDFILEFIFDDFINRMIIEQGEIDLRSFKTLLISLTNFRLFEDAHFKQKINYRYSLLPTSIQTQIADFFK